MRKLRRTAMRANEPNRLSSLCFLFLTQTNPNQSVVSITSLIDWLIDWDWHQVSASHSLLLLGRLSDSVSLFVSFHLLSINQRKIKRKKKGQGESQAGVVGRPSPNHFLLLLLLHFLVLLKILRWLSSCDGAHHRRVTSSTHSSLNQSNKQTKELRSWNNKHQTRVRVKKEWLIDWLYWERWREESCVEYVQASWYSQQLFYW